LTVHLHWRPRRLLLLPPRPRLRSRRHHSLLAGRRSSPARSTFQAASSRAYARHSTPIIRPRAAPVAAPPPGSPMPASSTVTSAIAARATRMARHLRARPCLIVTCPARVISLSAAVVLGVSRFVHPVTPSSVFSTWLFSKRPIDSGTLDLQIACAASGRHEPLRLCARHFVLPRTR
jgi:hypothetical protein